MKKKESLIGVRVTEEELEQLDLHTQGGLSRSQVVRALIQDYLAKPTKEQRDILIRRLLVNP